MRMHQGIASAASVAVGLCIVHVIYLHASSILQPTVLVARTSVPVIYSSQSAGGQDGRMLVSLAAGQPKSEDGQHWGHWRTPGNSNAFEGMKRPVQNNNPLGDHIISRDLDKDVNISQIGKYDNPLIDALEGKGLPKMFYEDDLFAPCEGEHCQVVHPSNPVSKIHTHWTGKPRGFGYGTGKQRDLYVRCSDPTSMYYNEACDPARNHYGRPLRPGSFPDDNQIVDRHLWAKNKVSPNSYAVRWFPFRHNLSASTFDFRPRGLKIPGNSGMMKTPYTGTGYYGGLSGPPFFTEGPRGSEQAPVDHSPHPYLKFKSLTPEEWERLGLGDDAIPAQPIVGHEEGVNDQMYRFRYVNMDRHVFQKNETEEGVEPDENGSGKAAAPAAAAAKQLGIVGLRQTAASHGRVRAKGDGAVAHKSSTTQRISLHPLSLLPLLSPTLPPAAQLGLEGGLARLAQGGLSGPLQHSVLAKAQQYLTQARIDFERAKEDEEEVGGGDQQSGDSEENGGAGGGGGGDEKWRGGQDAVRRDGERGVEGAVATVPGMRGEGGRRGQVLRASREGHVGGEGQSRDAVPTQDARNSVPIEKVVGAVESVFGGAGTGAGTDTRAKLEKTKRGLESTGEQVARMEQEMSQWKQRVEAGKAAAYDSLPQTVMSEEGEKRLLAAALGHPLPPEPKWQRDLKPSGLDGVAVRKSGSGEEGVLGAFNGMFSDKVSGIR